MLRDWTDSVSVDGISAEAERLFTRLIMKADDYGRFHAEPRLVRALCFPLSESIKSDNVRKWLEELHAAGLVFRYDVREKPILAIVNFGQRLKQSRAKFPEPEGEDECWLPTSGNFREGDGSSGLKTNRNRKENEHEGAGALNEFDRFWQTYPRQKAKGTALKAWVQAIKIATPETIIKAVVANKHGQDWLKENGKYIPYPATWLNAQGWLDEVRQGTNGSANTFQLLPVP